MSIESQGELTFCRGLNGRIHATFQTTLCLLDVAHTAFGLLECLFAGAPVFLVCIQALLLALNLRFDFLKARSECGLFVRLIP